MFKIFEKKSFRKAFAIAKINFRQKALYVYIITAILMLVAIVLPLMPDSGTGEQMTNVSPGTYLYVLAILLPIFVSTYNFTHLMNIGAKKKDYFNGCALTYILTAAVISLVSSIVYGILVLTKLNDSVMDIISMTGWNTNVVTMFLCQFAILLLLQSFIHTLILVQGKWYGWVANGVILLLITIFSLIPGLQNGDFALVIEKTPNIVQLLVLFMIAICIYSSSYFVLKLKRPK